MPWGTTVMFNYVPAVAARLHEPATGKLLDVLPPIVGPPSASLGPRAYATRQGDVCKFLPQFLPPYGTPTKPTTCQPEFNALLRVAR